MYANDWFRAGTKIELQVSEPVKEILDKHYVMMDTSCVSQCLSHLVFNAIKVLQLYRPAFSASFLSLFPFHFGLRSFHRRTLEWL